MFYISLFFPIFFGQRSLWFLYIEKVALDFFSIKNGSWCFLKFNIIIWFKRSNFQLKNKNKIKQNFDHGHPEQEEVHERERLARLG